MVFDEPENRLGALLAQLVMPVVIQQPNSGGSVVRVVAQLFFKTRHMSCALRAGFQRGLHETVKYPHCFKCSSCTVAISWSVCPNTGKLSMRKIGKLKAAHLTAIVLSQKCPNRIQSRRPVIN